MYGSPPLLFGCFPQMAAVSGFRIRSLVHCFQTPLRLKITDSVVDEPVGDTQLVFAQNIADQICLVEYFLPGIQLPENVKII